MLAGDRFVHVDTWTIFDPVYRQRQVELLCGLINCAKGNRRYENPMFIQNLIGLDDQIPNGPALIIQKEVHDAPNATISSVDFVPFQFFQT